MTALGRKQPLVNIGHRQQALRFRPDCLWRASFRAQSKLVEIPKREADQIGYARDSTCLFYLSADNALALWTHSTTGEEE